MRSEQEVSRAIERYADTVQRLCVVYLKNYADTEDVFQTVFFKYYLSSKVFDSDEHEKAWIIRVTINACKDHLKSFFHRHVVSFDEISELPYEQKLTDENSDVLDAVLSLPEKNRSVVYLHYYEDYTAPEISRLLHINVNTVYTLLTRSKELLRRKLEGEYGK